MAPKYISFLTGTFCAIIVLLFPHCKKVVKNEERLNSLPSLITSHASIYGTGQGTNREDNYEYYYKTQFQIGDTMELAGTLFPQSLRVQIGNGTGNVVVTKRITIHGTAEVPTIEGDFIKLVVTREMGIGLNRPVVITANGYSMVAPPVTIVGLPPFTGKTDTTLVVDSLLSFKDPALSRLDKEHIIWGNVSSAGQLCFYNGKNVYHLPAGAAQPTKVVTVNTAYGNADDLFKFKVIRAAAISWDERILYISGEVIDSGPNNPELATNPRATPYGVARLCKLNLETGEITTINRSFFGGWGSRLYETPGPGPLNGSLQQVTLVANKIRLDKYDNLYVENAVSLDQNSVVNVTSKVDASGQVKTLLSNDVRYPGQYIASPDGFALNPVTLMGFTGIRQSFSISNPSYYDFAQEEPPQSYSGVKTEVTYSYFDTSRTTGYASNKKSEIGSLLFLVAFNPRRTAIFSTGEMVFFGDVRSPSSFNLEKKVAYTYAGAEINAVNHSMVPAEIGTGTTDFSNGLQVNTTGSARYVDFSGVQVLGVDEKNAIYFFRPATKYAVEAPPENAARIYKLYKPK